MKKIVLATTALFAIMGAHAADQATVDTYNKTCVICHGTGAAGAPKFAVAEDWAPRLEQGMPALVKAVDVGMGAMPPKGMCTTCTPEEFEKLITYMSTGK